MRKTSKFRLCVVRSNRYISAQLIEHGIIDKIVGCISSNQAELKAKLKGKTSNKAAAELVGNKIAELAKGLKITEVSFDRSGYKYHGCVAELANAARSGGLKF
jgi:large subunit ribosomal protein L18